MKKLILLAIPLLIGVSLYAQKYNASRGYIVAGDTITGYIKHSKNLHDSIAFCSREQERFSYYTPSEISEYGFENGPVYHRLKFKFNGEVYNKFVKELVSGEASLFNFEDIYFLKKENEYFRLEYELGTMLKNVPVKDIRYKVVLEEALKDCENINDKISTVRYSNNELAELIDYYNTETNVASKRVYKNKIRVKKGFRVGYEHSTVHFPHQRTNFVIRNFDSSGSIVFGGFLNFSKDFSRFSLQPEVLFVKRETKGFEERIADQHNVVISSTKIKVPLSLYYTFPTYKVKPFLCVGAVTEYEVEGENFSEDILHFDGATRTHDLDFNKFGIGFKLGAGISKAVSEDIVLNFEYNYEVAYSNFDFIKDYFNWKTHTFSMSIAF